MNTVLVPEHVAAMIERGSAVLKEARDRRKRESEAEQDAKRESNKAKWETLAADVRDAIPELGQYATLDDLCYDHAPSRREEVTIAVPGLAQISTQFGYDGDLWSQKSYSDYDFRLIYRVAKTDWYLDDNDRRHVREDWDAAILLPTIELALAVAYEYQVERVKLEAECERYNAEIDAQAEKSNNQARDRSALESAEREHLVNIVRLDPVAAALVNVLAAVLDERAAWQVSVNDLHSSLESQAIYHERRAVELRREVESALSEARAERNRAEDAEDEADRARRDMKRLRYDVF